MKRTISLALAIILSLCLIGCGSNNKEVQNEAPTSTPTKVESDENYIDLTTLSSTMVYSEVFDMINTPENYIGKTVKMSGDFSYYYDEVGDNYYFACIIADATACCSQGIEFELKGEHTYPDDYPELGDEITVVGTFSTYTEGENMYCTLSEAEFIA